MSDQAEGGRPPAATAAAAADRGGGAAAAASPIPLATASGPAAGGGVVGGPPLTLEQYVVIHIRVHHLKLLLFFIVTVSSIGGAAYGYFRLPLLFLPSTARNDSFTHDPLGDSARLFVFQHDRNGDGVLDADEVEPLAFLLWEAKAVALDHEQPVAAGEELVKVKAFFEPLQLSTMSKKLNATSTVLTTVASVAQQFFGLGLLPSLLMGRLPTAPRLTSLQGLLDWKAPHRETTSFGARSLAAAFLPPSHLADLALGEPYTLADILPSDEGQAAAAASAPNLTTAAAAEAATRQRAAAAAAVAAAAAAEESPDVDAAAAAVAASAEAALAETASAESALAAAAPPTVDRPGATASSGRGEPIRLHILSNRYYPPRVNSDAAATLHRLLAMFHPRPFLLTRFPPQGNLGCLRAFNDEYAEVVFRIHAEYQLSEPPLYPFWFTPSQFKGSVIIARNSSSIAAFRLYVPNDRRLNVDMEWMNAPREEENLEVDIGYVPRMELVALQEDADGFAQPPVAPSSFVWTKEVQIDVCERNMEVYFYPFKKVPYLNYTEAFAEARRSGGKLVHSIVLWGALDDQSC